MRKNIRSYYSNQIAKQRSAHKDSSSIRNLATGTGSFFDCIGIVYLSEFLHISWLYIDYVEALISDLEVPQVDS